MDVQELLTKPKADVSLSELREQLNALAQLRMRSRAAFCHRLAVAYMLVTGRPFGKAVHDGGNTKFVRWCSENLRSSTGKMYAPHTLYTYLAFGTSADVVAAVRRNDQRNNKRVHDLRMLNSRLVKAVETGAQVVSISVLRQRRAIDGDIAGELNKIMSAWEDASPQARAQFLYSVTGRRIA